MSLYHPENLVAAQAELGEGPAWDAFSGLLYWVNIPAGELHIYSPATRQDIATSVGQMIGCVAPRRGDGVVVGLRGGIATFNLDTFQLTWLAQPETHLLGNRFNDGKCDPAGRLIAGTMSIDESKTGQGSLYSIEQTGAVRTLLNPVSISNGLAWSPDLKTMYYIDTPTRQVMAYQYDLLSGEIYRPRVAVKVDPADGWPDGMTSDMEGMLWVAIWHGAKVIRYNPANGRKLLEIPVPALNVTSCVFGGPTMDELFITTAWSQMTLEERNLYPASGDLFCVKVDVEGLPTFAFAG
jgi:sugar lactone lactonase YvrE